jgi:hypothetical protein
VIKNALTFIILAAGAAGLAAQDARQSPFYVGLSAGFSQADLRAYMGGKSFGHAFELGYDWTKPEDFVGIRLYGVHSRWLGDYSERLDVVQKLISWGAGVEFSFQTPISGLRPYLGAGMMFWDGSRETDSVYLGTLRGQYVTGEIEPLPAGPHPEGQGKLGIRMGLNYRIIKDLSVSLDYNFYGWRNDSFSADGDAGLVYPYSLKGYNRVMPSWVGLTVKYHFNMTY